MVSGKTTSARRRFVASLAILVLTCLTLGGCGRDSVPVATASGSVSAGGSPLSGAVITLEPVGNTAGPNASAPVIDGRFEFGPDAGLLGGKYLVRVAMMPAEILAKFPPDQSASLPPLDAVIAPRFDVDSTLKCELKLDNKNELEFAVEFL